MSALIHVTPETCQEDAFEDRHDIAEFAREGAIAPDASIPQCVTLCFLADRTSWFQPTLVRQPADPIFAAFRRWGEGNPVAAEITREVFDRHLRKFMHATALSYTINPDTSTIAHVQGLRLMPQSRSDRERDEVIARLGLLDHPAF